MIRIHGIVSLAAFAALFLPAVCAQDVLLVPRYGTTANPATVAAFSAADGSLVNETFIPADGRLRQPVNVIPSGSGTLLISDTLADAIFEYDLGGNYVRTLTDLATSGLDGPKGIDIRGGVLYAVVSQGAMADTIQRYDAITGAPLGTWASGFTNGQDIHFRAADALLSDFDSDDIHRFSLAGAPLPNLVTSDAVTGIGNPYQIQSEPNGNILVGSFANGGAVYQYDSNGNQLAKVGTGFVRGGYRLDNGNLFYSQNNAITIVDGAGGMTNVLSTGNWQYIERVSLTPIPEPGTLALLGLGAAALAGRRRRR